MRIRNGLGTALFVCCMAAAGLGCEADERVCTPGATAACVCPGGASGVQSCIEDGTRLGVCECGTTVVSDGGLSVCTPNCGGRGCGPDGCGGVCGSCAAGRTCTLGQCVVPSCSSCSECGVDEVCELGVCRSPWGHTYQVDVYAVALPERAPGGGCWDSGCDAPDPGVNIHLNGSVRGTWCGVADRFSASYSGGFAVTLNASSRLGIEAYDADWIAYCDETGDRGVLWTFEPTALRDLICNGTLDLHSTSYPGTQVSGNIVALD